MEKDYYNIAGFNIPPYYGYEGMESNTTQGQSDSGNIFNPIIQYEQAYMYYRYLTQQMDYKIKCKEYEKLNNNDYSRSGNRKIE